MSTSQETSEPSSRVVYLLLLLLLWIASAECVQGIDPRESKRDRRQPEFVPKFSKNYRQNVTTTEGDGNVSSVQYPIKSEQLVRESSAVYGDVVHFGFDGILWAYKNASCSVWRIQTRQGVLTSNALSATVKKDIIKHLRLPCIKKNGRSRHRDVCPREKKTAAPSKATKEFRMFPENITTILVYFSWCLEQRMMTPKTSRTMATAMTTGFMLADGRRPSSGSQADGTRGTGGLHSCTDGTRTQLLA
ncbi:hypothetical protein LSTR_LSTR000813 [Laodelphax striatellus]|uniref:Uncharacterized protein n=1 Tax=Laodelphax striatellus TaxID=195883 RepID=A0A482XHR5_LAOST|nr:hypothetical protein LSTR_LSTR000813 [Laodelphax striatellus]